MVRDGAAGIRVVPAVFYLNPMQIAKPMTERIMDHDFSDGWCVRCGRSRTELVAYGHPDMKIEPGVTGLSCSSHTTNSEIESLRAAWKRDREKWDRVFG